jgi:hypothetical protein
MKIKVFVLIFLAAFAVVVPTILAELSIWTPIEKHIDNTCHFRFVSIDENITVGTERELDTPGMPG